MLKSWCVYRLGISKVNIIHCLFTICLDNLTFLRLVYFYHVLLLHVMHGLFSSTNEGRLYESLSFSDERKRKSPSQKYIRQYQNRRDLEFFINMFKRKRNINIWILPLSSFNTGDHTYATMWPSKCFLIFSLFQRIKDKQIKNNSQWTYINSDNGKWGREKIGVPELLKYSKK